MKRIRQLPSKRNARSSTTEAPKALRVLSISRGPAGGMERKGTMRHHSTDKPNTRAVRIPERIDQAFIRGIWGKKLGRLQRLIRKLRGYQV